VRSERAVDRRRIRKAVASSRLSSIQRGKGGSGKTTLAASLAVAAANTGEKVIAFDFDPQGSLTRWARRGLENAPHRIAIEQFETARLGRLGATLHRLDEVGFTLAIFDTPGEGVRP
jgi:chromosome partitioning protein